MKTFEEKNRWYWDERSEGYGKLRQKELSGPDRKAWSDFLLSRIPKKSGKVLDAGCGPAFLSILMAKAGWDVTAVDFSSAMLKVAAENGAREGVSIHFMEGDVMNLPFENKFDVILSRNVTWNLPDVPKAYESWYRALAPGGVLLNMDTDYGLMDFRETSKIAKNAHQGVKDSLIEICEELKEEVRISTHRRPMWDLERLKIAGFKNLRVEEDIRSFVHVSDEWDYDPAPLFCLRGEK